MGWGCLRLDGDDEAGEPVGERRPDIVSTDGDSFAPSTAPFMVNYRVADLRGLLEALEAEGCDVLKKVDESEYGKFGWVWTLKETRSSSGSRL